MKIRINKKKLKQFLSTIFIFDIFFYSNIELIS